MIEFSGLDQPDIWADQPPIDQPVAGHGISLTLVPAWVWRITGAMEPLCERLGLLPANQATPQAYSLSHGPDRRLLVAEGPEGAAHPPPWLASLSPGWLNGVALSDISDGTAVVALGGPKAMDLIADGCPLDLDQITQFPRGSVVTVFAGLPASVYRLGPDGLRVALDRTLAPHLWQWAREAVKVL